MFKKAKYRLITYLTKNLLKAITEEDVIRLSGKDYLIGRTKLSKEDLLNLKEEAESFKQSFLWKLIRNEIGFESNKQMFAQAQTPDDIIFGKAMLWDLDLIKMFIEKISKL